ncbi:MAG TPA: ABC transporter substrate-binding protein [Candidatus Dormibacteraeota bacterium]|nr:ABC transporter substrate-binding protein [Candidatus Dormibacteraeota bacterium]
MTLTRRGFVSSLAAAAALAPDAARAAVGRTLAIGHVPSTLFAPFYVAISRGYLEQAGFAASLQRIGSGEEAMALLANGQLDVVLGGISAATFNAVQRGFSVKILTSAAYQPAKGHPSALLVREGLYAAGLTSPAGLRGKSVAFIGGTGATAGYYVQLILRPVGLSLLDVDVRGLPSPDQGPALARRAIDAVFTAAPFTTRFEEQKLAHEIAAPPAGISCTASFIGPTLLKDPAAARAVLAAFVKGSRDVQGAAFYDPQNLAVFHTYTGLPVSLLRTIPHYDYDPDLRVDRKTLADMQRVFRELKTLAYATPLNTADMVARL